MSHPWEKKYKLEFEIISQIIRKNKYITSGKLIKFSTNCSCTFCVTSHSGQGHFWLIHVEGDFCSFWSFTEGTGKNYRLPIEDGIDLIKWKIDKFIEINHSFVSPLDLICFDSIPVISAPDE